MDLKKITDSFAVSGQITPEDVAEIHRLGYRGLICNRPDGEEPDQDDYDRIRAAAEAAGMQIRYVPIVHGVLGIEELTAFQEALDELPEPVLAYCRSGARCTAVYQAAQARLG